MRLILVGSEYAGKTTLADEIVKWRNRVMGPPTPLGIVEYHDHFTLPWVGHWDEIPEEDLKKFKELGPQLKEMFSRYQFSYHLTDELYADTDHILIGFHIEDAVYAPRYYGFGGAGEYGDRSSFARHIEAVIMDKAPDTVLVHVKATAEVIKERMKSNPHARTVLREEHVEEVLKEIEYHFDRSLLRNRITLDTSEATVEQTISAFIKDMEPHLSMADRLRIQTRSILQSGG